MKVLVGHSYFLHFDTKLEEAMQPYPPLGTLLAAAQLRDAGHEVVVFDGMLDTSTQHWSELIERHSPDVAVLYEDNFNYLSKMCLLRMRDAAVEMLGVAHAAGCFVAACGSDATDNESLYLDAGADVILRGEGDATLLAVIENVSREEAVAQVAGTTTHDRHHELTRAPDRPNLKALDDLPGPARDLVDIERYRQIWNERHGRFSVNMVTTRGCPFHCNWCAKPIWGQRYNARSPEDVVAEMVALRDDYRPDHIWFADDIFGLKPGWIQRFSELVADNDVRIPFKCLSRPDLLVRKDTAEALGEAGCEEVWIGAESGSQKILDAMEKGTTVKQIEEAADRVHAAGFRVAFFLQFGYPGEERRDIKDTLRLVRRARPDDIGISVSYPLPGTPFHDRVFDKLGVRRNWEDSADMAMLFDGPFPTEFYRALHTRVHREFRPRRLWQDWRAGRRPKFTDTIRALRDIAFLPFSIVRVRMLARATAQPLPSVDPHLDRSSASTPSEQPVVAPTVRTGS